jgi:hypothetical protein
MCKIGELRCIGMVLIIIVAIGGGCQQVVLTPDVVSLDLGYEPAPPPKYETHDGIRYKIVGKNKDGWKVGKKDDGSFWLYDPLLRRWFAAEYNEATEKVQMQKTALDDWRSSRIDKLPPEKRTEGTVPAGEDGGDGCFDPETQVLLADGSLKNISRIGVGDRVKSFNVETGVMENKAVTRSYVFATKGYFMINDELKATAKHKFLMAGSGPVWKKAAELKIGDRVKSTAGEIVIESVEEIREKAEAHNFLVVDTKAYVVVAGENKYVVHNGL